MGRGSGGTRNTGGNKGSGGLPPSEGDYRGKVEKVETLKNIQNPALYKEVKSAISRFESALGFRQRNVKLAVLENGVGGVHRTTDGKSEGVYLNSKVFKEGTVKSVSQWSSGAYTSGHLTRTNKPVAHIVTHELAHATWNAHMTGTRQTKAAPELKRLYSQWRKERPSGYGRYASTNISEWFAETATKAIHGTADKYTRGVKRIIKKYGL